MKTRIYLSILIFLGMIGVFPIISYADDTVVNSFSIVSFNDLVESKGGSLTLGDVLTDIGVWIYRGNYKADYYSTDLGMLYINESAIIYSDTLRPCVMPLSVNLNIYTLFLYDISTDQFTSSIFTFGRSSSNRSEYSFLFSIPNLGTGSALQTKDTGSYTYNLSGYSDFNLPVFDGTINAKKAWVDNDWSGLINSGSGGSENLGHIIQTGYKFNPSKIYNEFITWDKTKSSTGYEYQSFDMVEFYAMDRSIKTLKNDIGALGGVSELVDWAERQLEKFVYPKGSNEYRIVSGRSGVSGSYGKMIHVLGVEANSGKAELAVINSMQNNSYDTDFQNYIRSQIGSLDKRSWYDKAYQWFTGNTYVYDVCYDIYCVIEDVNGNQGTWYKINFHDTPLPEREVRLNGGVTVTPVKPDRTIDPDSTDWQDVNFTEINEGDTNIDNSDNSVTTYITNNEGDDYYITNNYTYNYDNRSWIENHYTNEDVSEVDEGIEWLKLFPNFFGLFQKLFGAFLPGWASVVVTLAIPIVAGLLVFKIIKGVIPFV